MKELYNLHHLVLRNIIECAFRLFKKRFQYFKLIRVNFPLSTEVLLVYILTAVHNFLNIHDLDNLNNYSIIKDKAINKEDAQIAKKECNININ